MTTYQILSLLGIPSLLAAVLLGVFNWGKARAIKKLREQEETRTNKDKEHNLLMDGVVAILHNMVYTQGKAHIARGKITFEDMKDYEYLYNAYHAMGGNGTGTEIYNRVKDLPTEQAEGSANED